MQSDFVVKVEKIIEFLFLIQYKWNEKKNNNGKCQQSQSLFNLYLDASAIDE